ncbi:MAG: PcfB family protein [Mogibacterium sp.]|nr:PcfB family protein [Mogibacterium sp.]
MNPGGDAAEQVVRLSLEGVEVAAKISGAGAKNIALLLYATLKQVQKTKGKARLTSMLKSGKELKVYTITNKDLAKFSQEAKRYGVLYCVLKDRKNTDPNAAVDVIARAEDASKIQRITERFKLATVNRADVSLEIQKDKERMFPKDKSVKEALRGGQAGNQSREAAPESMPVIDESMQR